MSLCSIYKSVVHQCERQYFLYTITEGLFGFNHFSIRRCALVGTEFLRLSVEKLLNFIKFIENFRQFLMINYFYMYLNNS